MDTDLVKTAHVKHFIRKHLSAIRGPADVAAYLHLSCETLRKTFRREAGLPLGRFITHARLERAKQLLALTELTCAEISFRVGFSREDVAARTFKRIVGVSMLCYRQAVREQAVRAYQQGQPAGSTSRVNQQGQPAGSTKKANDL